MKKLNMIFCIILILLSAIFFSGCEEKKSMDSTTAQNIMTNMMNSLKEINSYSYVIDGSIIINDVNMGITDGYVEFDLGNKKMKMDQNITMSMFGNANTQTYIINNIEYTNKTEQSSYVELTKKNITENIWDNYDSYGNQDEINEISEIKRLEDETIDNIDCYVIEIIPDMDKYFQVMNNLNETYSGYTLNGIEIKYWVEKVGYLPIKIYTKLDMYTSSRIYGDMIYIYETENLYSNYNSQFLIELPQWASEANWIY